MAPRFQAFSCPHSLLAFRFSVGAIMIGVCAWSQSKGRCPLTGPTLGARLAMDALDTEPTPAREFLAGARDQLPLLLAVVPFGLIFGALALSAGIPPLAAQGFSLLVFAGSAQFIAAGLIAKGAPAGVVAFTILVVNLRHALYSASMASYFRPLPSRWKLALSWLLTDEAFAMASHRYRQAKAGLPHWYTLGTGMTLWAAWQVSTSIGIALGARVPENLALDFAVPLTFLALLVPTLRDRPSLGAAISAGTLAVVFAGLPHRLGLLLAAMLGVATALAIELLGDPLAEPWGERHA